MFSIRVETTTVKSLVHFYHIAVYQWVGRCPVCGSPLVFHGSYPRKTPVAIGPFRIQRVRCSGSRRHPTHGLIPCFIVPYDRLLIDLREAAIKGIVHDLKTIEALAESLGVDPTTIARWWRIFRQKAGVIVQFLARKLASSVHLANWIGPVSGDTHCVPRKALELIGHCRATFFQRFTLGDFACLDLFDPSLFFTPHAKYPGAYGTG